MANARKKKKAECAAEAANGGRRPAGRSAGKPAGRARGKAQAASKRCKGAGKKSHAALAKKAEVVLPLLQSLSDVKPTNRRSILLSHLDDEACELLYETIRHVISNENVTPKDKTRLAKALGPHKKDILSIVDGAKGGGKKARALKKMKLAQMGGFPLAAVLRFAIPMLLSAVMPN